MIILAIIINVFFLSVLGNFKSFQTICITSAMQNKTAKSISNISPIKIFPNPIFIFLLKSPLYINNKIAIIPITIPIFLPNFTGNFTIMPISAKPNKITKRTITFYYLPSFVHTIICISTLPIP